jgi:hypothetical protein
MTDSQQIIEELTIEFVDILKEGHKKDGTPYTWFKAKTQNGYYTFFDLNLQPGESNRFYTVTKPSEKINPKTGEPYLDKQIISYAGSLDTVSETFSSDPSKNVNLIELAKQVTDILQRLDNLERFTGAVQTEPAFDDINIRTSGTSFDSAKDNMPSP